MKYLTVGTDEIREDLLRKVEDTKLASSMKPKGGLWLTEYNEKSPKFNYWVDYMLLHPNILFYKNKGNNVWNQPCSLVSLKDDSCVFQLDSIDKLNNLMMKYPTSYQKFSYEKMSRDFDGIFVDLGNLFHGNMDYELVNKLFSFGVDSLILFNLGCIDYYQSGKVNIEPFDPEDSFYREDRSYEIKIENVRKKVLKK